MARQAIGSSRSGTRAKRSGGSACQSGSYSGTLEPRASSTGSTAASARKTASPRLPPHRHEAREREERNEPAEKDVLLDPGPDTAADEVGELGRVVPHLGERAPAVGDRPGDDDRCTATAAAAQAAAAAPAFHQSRRGTRAQA